MESRDIFADFSAQLAAAEENKISDYSTHPAILILISMWVVGIIITPFLSIWAINKSIEEGDRRRHNPLPADEPHEEAQQPEEPEPIDDPLNETLLASVGMDETQMRDHPKIGFFYDSVKRGLADHPVVLNTGEIVDQDTGETLVRNQTLLPRGRVTGFFSSYALRNLLGVLIGEEVEKRVEAKK